MFEKEASEYTDKRIIPIQQVSETDLYNAFKDGAEFGYNKAKKEAKTIIQDLLDNSDEYARQRAIDYLKGE